MKNWKDHNKFNEAKAAIEPQINTNVKSFLIIRNRQQINFVTLNRFCLLRKTSHPLFLMDNIKLGGIPSKIKLILIFVFQVLKVFLI